MEKFPDRHWRNVPIIFRHEPVLLETAGGLKNIEDLLDDDQTILCYNGDIISNLPLEPLLLQHERKQSEATLVLRSSGNPLNVSINAGDEICDLQHRLKNPGVKTCLFASIYAVETSILRYIEAGKVESIISTLIERITQQPGSVMGIVIDEGNWQNIDSVEAYERLNIQADTLEGRWNHRTK